MGTDDIRTLQDRLAVLGYKTYQDYLSGEHWKNFRTGYLDRSGRTRCAVCGDRWVELHHNTYSRLGGEKLHDVTPLCRDHHDAVHWWLDSRGKTAEWTALAVRELTSTNVLGAGFIRQKMRNRKNKERRGKYLPGATWKDVLSGRPVTPEEKRKKRGTAAGRTDLYGCESCKRKAVVKAEKKKAIYCFKCGGKMRREVVR